MSEQDDIILSELNDDELLSVCKSIGIMLVTCFVIYIAIMFVML